MSSCGLLAVTRWEGQIIIRQPFFFLLCVCVSVCVCVPCLPPPFSLQACFSLCLSRSPRLIVCLGGKEREGKGRRWAGRGEGQDMYVCMYVCMSFALVAASYRRSTGRKQTKSLLPLLLSLGVRGEEKPKHTREKKKKKKRERGDYAVLRRGGRCDSVVLPSW
ncbi:hypothetical protein GGR50DRAFT_373293 [Xylaria sp. CBS 124048]|nr:hypothetical protein GGR50DRAFT_373293 [Xylaria sp. CBS 124048]